MLDCNIHLSCLSANFSQNIKGLIREQIPKCEVDEIARDKISTGFEKLKEEKKKFARAVGPTIHSADWIECEQRACILAWQNPKQIGDLETMIIAERGGGKHDIENGLTFS